MKKTIAFLMIIAIVVLILFIVFLLLKQYEEKASIRQLPDIKVMTIDSSIIRLNTLQTNMPMMICYFHPECEFCAIEIEELINHKSKFENVQMIFVSFASINEIKKYLETYKIDSFKHVLIANDYKGDLVSKLNIKAPPTCFIYDKSLNLKRKIKGLTSVNELIKHIPHE